MRILTGPEESTAVEFLLEAARVADRAQCLRSQCGTVIVASGLVLGVGANSPPGGCAPSTCGKDALPAAFRSDRTCCVHAEQNAILDALVRHPALVAGSRLYFVRVDIDGAPKRSGRPYCTMCSKLTQAAGIAEFVLWHPEGVTVYDAAEYNVLSFAHADPDSVRP